MMIDSEAPLIFWREAVNTAVYLHQQTPNKGLTKETTATAIKHHIQLHRGCCKHLAYPLTTMMAMKSRPKLLSTSFGDSAVTPVDLSRSHNTIENSAQDPSNE
jgi:hypothetical protein